MPAISRSVPRFLCIGGLPAVMLVRAVVRQRAVVRPAPKRSWKIRLPRKIWYPIEGVALLLAALRQERAAAVLPHASRAVPRPGTGRPARPGGSMQARAPQNRGSWIVTFVTGR